MGFNGAVDRRVASITLIFFAIDGEIGGGGGRPRQAVINAGKVVGRG